MLFVQLVIKNLLKRPVRSTLTALGIAIAVMVIVAMIGVVDRFKQSLSDLLEGSGVDLVVERAGKVLRLSGSLEQSHAEMLEKLPHVARISAVLGDVITGSDLGALGMMVYGTAADNFMLDSLEISSGRRLAPQDADGAMLGSLLARQTNKSIGDPIEIEGHPFTVVGIFQSPHLMENSCAYVLLPTLQKLMDRPNHVTSFQIALADALVDRQAVTLELKTRIEGLKDEQGRSLGLAATPARDYSASLNEMQFIDAMAWATSLVALVIGTVGTLNTMLMSVFERTQEIGILRAIGWTRRRVLQMILCEAAVLCVLGALWGVLLANLTIVALARLKLTQSLIHGGATLSSILLGVLLSIGVGLLAGLYPATLAAQVSPAESLRHD